MSIVHNPESSFSAISPADVSSVPECVLWLPCNESGSGITSLADAVSGSTQTIASATGDGTKISVPNTSGAAFSGTLPSLTGDFAVLMALKFDTTTVGAVTIGAIAGQRVVVASGGTVGIVGADGTAALDVVAQGAVKKVYVKSDADADAYLYQGAVGAALANTLNPLASAHGAVDFSDEMTFFTLGGNAIIDLYGLAVFDLSSAGFRSDFDTWADWILEQWADGNKVLPEVFSRL